jgi:putative transposase
VYQIRTQVRQATQAKTSGYGDAFFIDEVFVKINRKQHYLRRPVDQDGEVVGVLLQARRDGRAAKRFSSDC